MLPEMRPEALAIPTITPVSTTLLFSEIELLEYYVASITDGVLLPIQSRKHALFPYLQYRAFVMEGTAHK